MASRTTLLCAAALAAAPIAASAASSTLTGELPRRPHVGIGLTQHPDGEPGGLIQGLGPGSPMGAAGIESGDLIVKIGDRDIVEPSDLMAAFHDHHEGDTMTVEYIRDGERQSLDMEFKTLPLEEYDGVEVIYGSVETDSGLHRTITMKPEGDGPFPTVFYIQGYPCQSVEFYSQGVSTNLRDFALGVVRDGYVFHRMEKSNIGDSTGEPCIEMGVVKESENFLVGLRDLKEKPFVDPDQVFLFGHSMGGLSGPYMAAREPVAGIIAYGSGGRTFAEYWDENVRRQSALAGADPAALDEQIRLTQKWIAGYFIDGLHPDEVFERYPELEEARSGLGVQDDYVMGRHYTFWQEVHDMNTAEALRDANTRVLAAWGSADFVASRVDHEWMAATVNVYNDGWGEFAVVPDSDHIFFEKNGEQDAFDNRFTGEFNPAIVEITLDWLERVRGEIAAEG